MAKATIHEAKINLPKLMKKALAGEEIIIDKRNQPLVKLASIAENLHGDLVEQRT